MDYHELEKMTVTALRDQAKEHGVTGVTGKKKEELVEILAEKLGIEKPHKTKKFKHKTPLDKSAIKAKITELKAERKKAHSDNDRKAANVLRRRIHSLKRRLQKVV